MSDPTESGPGQRDGELLLLEPFYGGSHRQLVDLLKSSIPGCTLLTLPPSKWHWRARTAALSFAFQIPHEHTYKLLFASSVLNLAELVALRPDLSQLKKVLYFHENQLVYPVRKQQDRDFQYGYNQITSCLVADAVVFNSNYNRDSFLSSVDSFLKLMPNRPRNVAEKIRPKCRVLYFPLDFPDPLTIPEITTSNGTLCNSGVSSPQHPFHYRKAEKHEKTDECSAFVEKELSEFRTKVNEEDGAESNQIATDLCEPFQEDLSKNCRGAPCKADRRKSHDRSMVLDEVVKEPMCQTSANNPKCAPHASAKSTSCAIVSVKPSTKSCKGDQQVRLCDTYCSKATEYSAEEAYSYTDQQTENSCREDKADDVAVSDSQYCHVRMDEALQRGVNMCTLNEIEVRSTHQYGKKHGGESPGRGETFENSCSITMQTPSCTTSCDHLLSDGNQSDVPPLHILWPHRWEHDKNPALFFATLFQLHDEGYDFKLSVLGENYQEIPVIFTEARCKLKEHILHWGYLPTKDDYYRVLAMADVVVSTAIHEFFGVAMLEATHFGCYPLCPHRLVYPEIYQAEYLYRTPAQLMKRLKRYCRHPNLPRHHHHQIDLSTYSWKKLRSAYGQLLTVTM